MTYDPLPTVVSGEAIETDWGNQVKDNFDAIVAGSFVDLAHAASGGNLALSTSFQTALTHPYTPPAAWGTYKVQAEVWVSGAGLTSGDQLQLVAQITGGGAGSGTTITDDAASATRSTKALIELTGITGAIDVLTRVRNATASRGTVYVSVSKLIAIRTS